MGLLSLKERDLFPRKFKGLSRMYKELPSEMKKTSQEVQEISQEFQVTSSDIYSIHQKVQESSRNFPGFIEFLNKGLSNAVEMFRNFRKCWRRFGEIHDMSRKFLGSSAANFTRKSGKCLWNTISFPWNFGILGNIPASSENLPGNSRNMKRSSEYPQ